MQSFWLLDEQGCTEWGVGGSCPNPLSQVLQLHLRGCPWAWAHLGTPPWLPPRQDLAILLITEGSLACPLAKNEVSVALFDSSLLIVANTYFLAVSSSSLIVTPATPSATIRWLTWPCSQCCPTAPCSRVLFYLFVSPVVHWDAKFCVLCNFYEYLLLWYKWK